MRPNLTRRPKTVLLFFWVFMFSYNRHYFLDDIFGDNGSQGMYWIPADIFMFALFAIWIFEVAILKRPVAAAGPPMGRWFLPFFAACTVSAFAAIELNWGLFELWRWVKFGLILFYLRYNIRQVDWWVIAA